MQDKTDMSLGELLAGLSRELTTLIRQEVALARAEVGQTASRAARDTALLVGGGVLAHVGLLCIVAGIVLAVGLVLPLWVSALLVGVVIAAIGLFLAQQGLDALRRLDLAPQQTVETLKEDAAWAKDQVQGGGR